MCPPHLNRWISERASAKPLGPKTISDTTATSRASGAPTPKKDAAMTFNQTQSVSNAPACSAHYMQFAVACWHSGQHTFLLFEEP